MLKDNVRGRIVSWSNWTLLTRFLLQSDSPDDGTPHIVGEKRQSRRFYSSAGGFAVGLVEAAAGVHPAKARRIAANRANNYNVNCAA